MSLGGQFLNQKGLIDSGAEENLIHPSVLADYKQHYYVNPAPPMASINQQPIKTYGSCSLFLKLTDSQGTTRTQRHRFVIADIGADQVVLGFPWLASVDPAIRWSTRQWRFPIRELDLSVSASHKELRSARIAVAINVTPVVDSDGSAEDLHDPPQKRLPIEYAAYETLGEPEEAYGLPEHSLSDHRIELEEGAQPPWGPLYPLSGAELEELRGYLDKMQARGWIRPSTSPAGAPILFVPKKGGKLRLCVDYRALNRVTRKDRTPLPLIAEILDRLSSAKVYTKLDLREAYHRLRIREGDEWKTAFRTKYGHFEYCVMPFGLTNAPATFQAYINKALAGLVDVVCIVYLDDILIYSADLASHKQHVRQVLDRLDRWDLYLNTEKCEFHTEKVGFLGFVVTPEGISMEEDRVAAIKQWPLPRSVGDIQTFLGFTGFYRRFIRGYSKVASPLTDLLRGSKTGPLELPLSARIAFRHLCELFANAPLLRHYDPALPTRLETDASKFAVGAVLTQEFQGRWHPIAFRSRKLSPTETRYGVGDIELLAIVDAATTWRHYLMYLDHKVNVITDHLNLKYWHTKRALSSRQLRWLDELGVFDLVIQYRPGNRNPADGLSRRPDHKESGSEAQELRSFSDFVSLQSIGPRGMIESPTLARKVTSGDVRLVLQRGGKAALEHERWGRGRSESQTSHPKSESCAGRAPARGALGAEKGAWGSDRDGYTLPRLAVVRSVVTALEQLDEPMIALIRRLQQEDAFVTQEAWRKRRSSSSKAGNESWSMDDGLLRYKGRVFVPPVPELRMELLQAYHDDATAGHLGASKTKKQIGRSYFWPSLSRDVKKYVHTCAVCQRTKASTQRTLGLLAPLPTPTRPWQEISMDFVVKLPSSFNPTSQKTCDAILVIVDRYTKYALYYATTTKLSSSGLADILYSGLFPQFGIPEGIVSDRGSVFTGNFWKEFCYHLGTKRRLSTAFHPQTDGQTERQNQNLEHYLRTYCSTAQADWARLLPLAQFTYNVSTHSATGLSPAQALMGIDPRMPTDPPPLRNQRVPGATERVQSLLRERKAMEKRLQRAHGWYKKWYDKGRRDLRFKPGDLVLLSAKNRKQTRPSRKLADKYLGPFKVLEVVGAHGLAYRLDLPKGYRIHNVLPISALKPFRSREGEAVTAREDIGLEADETFEVEAILGHRGPPRSRQYLIRWQGYTSADDSWEPRGNIDDGPLIQEYEDRLRERT